MVTTDAANIVSVAPVPETCTRREQGTMRFALSCDYHKSAKPTIPREKRVVVGRLIGLSVVAEGMCCGCQNIGIGLQKHQQQDRHSE